MLSELTASGRGADGGILAPDCVYAQVMTQALGKNRPWRLRTCDLQRLL